MTVLFVTHDVDEAIRMGTRVAVLRMGGRLAQYSPPAELLMHPADDYVARFVGGDRALKRLALLTVADLRLAPPGLLGDGPTLPAGITLRDALDALLRSPRGVGSVVDGEGRPLGSLNLEAVAATVRREAERVA